MSFKKVLKKSWKKKIGNIKKLKETSNQRGDFCCCSVKGRNGTGEQEKVQYNVVWLRLRCACNTTRNGETIQTQQQQKRSMKRTHNPKSDQQDWSLVVKKRNNNFKLKTNCCGCNEHSNMADSIFIRKVVFYCIFITILKR